MLRNKRFGIDLGAAGYAPKGPGRNSPSKLAEVGSGSLEGSVPAPPGTIMPLAEPAPSADAS